MYMANGRSVIIIIVYRANGHRVKEVISYKANGHRVKLGFSLKYKIDIAPPKSAVATRTNKEELAKENDIA